MNKASLSKLWQRGKTLLRQISSLNIPVYAAHTSFFMVLSLFPMLVLLLSLLRYTGLAVDTLTDILQGFLPDALMGAAKRLILNTYQSTTGTVLSISALTALWSASRGIHGLITGLNAIYGVPENRGYFRTRSVSVVYTFLFLLVLLLTLVLNIFGNTLLRLFPAGFISRVVDLRSILLLLVQTVLFTAVFMALPNQRNKFRHSLPGAVFAALGWMIFTRLYSVYVEHFAGLSNVYGSVYAVALSMLWLYCCISIVFYGGTLNRILTEKEQ